MKMKQEQIEEMAKQMCGAINNSCIHDCTPACGAREYAKRCFEAGYRKASDVIDEFVERLIQRVTENNTDEGYLDESIDYTCLMDDINELADEMRHEVEK